MPTRKTASESVSTPATHTPQSNKRTVSFSLPNWVRLPKDWMPLLMVLLLLVSVVNMVFLIMISRGLSGGGTYAAGSAGTQPSAGGAAPSVAPGTPVDVSVGNLPVMGDKNAKVKVIEFADFQCPFCEQWFKNVGTQLKKDYIDTGKIAFYWRDYPFLGQESTDSANAARCANEQGKFWDFHDYLYTHQGQENSGTFSKDNLKKFAADMGLDTGKFNTCIDSDKYAKDAQTDLSDGQKAGVNGTPTVFVNGIAVVGAQPYTAFKQAIDAALAK